MTPTTGIHRLPSARFQGFVEGGCGAGQLAVRSGMTRRANRSTPAVSSAISGRWALALLIPASRRAVRCFGDLFNRADAGRLVEVGHRPLRRARCAASGSTSSRCGPAARPAGR